MPNPEEMTAEQAANYNHLAERRPHGERIDLVCPDCGAAMRLRLGRFGRFYGCVEFQRTSCRGSHGADVDGNPLGFPVNQEGRKARQEALLAFQEFKSRTSPEDVRRIRLEMERIAGRPNFAVMTLEQASQIRDIITAELNERFPERVPVERRSAWERLSLAEEGE